MVAIHASRMLRHVSGRNRLEHSTYFWASQVEELVDVAAEVVAVTVRDVD